MLAADNNARESLFARYERGIPPPYAKPTESEEIHDAPRPQSLPKLGHELPAEWLSIMDAPIRTGEIDLEDLASSLEIFDVYHDEAHLEKARLDSYWWARPTFLNVKGSQRLGILVRHNIKRRWERLGVWNPEWGFPGRRHLPSDDASRWKWPWQKSNEDASSP